MSWKLTPWAQTRESLAGIPWRDLTDDEYAAALRLHPALGDRGYFEADDDAGTGTMFTGLAGSDYTHGPSTSETDAAMALGTLPEEPVCTCRWKDVTDPETRVHANYCAVNTAAEEGD